MDDFFGSGLGDGLGDGLAPSPFDTGAVVPTTGLSLDYHKFDDPNTDSGLTLNVDSAVVRQIDETAYGLAWITPSVWTGAVVEVYAVKEYSDPPELAGVTGTGFVDGTDTHMICYDFVGGPVWPVGNWVFHAKMTLGAIVDVTSGILVTDDPDLI
ncbi:hypothetical protein CCAX7_54330 [Capsulimonas corticalis]|uniref:Uncharacterized protein n=1 Tax=Capsulimonas corticalis TaxID=2219043 RepID=A0A402CNK6_9BACT|nr:hypothetical protein [Capsulimonas corticalis]BDI33382.1 hypothetical protein CCAX7_54330 [Capsulimonas corticalis]